MRPVPPPRRILARPARLVEPHDGSATPTMSPPHRLATVTGSVAAAIFVGLLVVLWAGSRPLAAQRETATATTIPVVQTVIVERVIAPASVTTPTPTICTPASSYLDIITRQEQAGDYASAVATAETALSVSDLCREAIKPLTARLVAIGLKALYTEPVAPLDQAGQQRQVDRYLSLRQRAHDAHADFASDVQIAIEANSRSQHRLCLVALDNAFADGSFRPTVQRDLTHLYVSCLYGLGSWYTSAGHASELYVQGLAWLSASHRVAVAYCTGQAEAATRLRELIGADESGWPTPADTPLLTHPPTIPGCA